jgi:hypothetical protein
MSALRTTGPGFPPLKIPTTPVLAIPSAPQSQENGDVLQFFLQF